MPNPQNLIPITSETAKQLGSKGGSNKKGKKHLTTWIQELLEDEAFEAGILDAKKGYVEYKGAPIKAIVQVATVKAVNGDLKAADLLMKYGWAQKQEIDMTSNGETISQPLDVDTLSKFMGTLKDDTKTNEGNA